jgi:hypothetical protein
VRNIDELELDEIIQNTIYKGKKTFSLYNQSTLVIGLGGTGIRWACKTKELLMHRYHSELAKHVDFLFIDSDENALNDEQYKKIINKETETIQLNKKPVYDFSSAGVPENISPWFNPVLKGTIRDLVDAGAGARRMVGRTLFYTSTQAMRSKIFPILERYDKKAAQFGSTNPTPARVIIMAGISGGTGSGTFIDMPYFIRYLINAERLQSFRTTGFKIFGIFELPDETAFRVRESSPYARKSKNYANGYAALRELDYFMHPINQEGVDKIYREPFKAQFEKDRSMFIENEGKYIMASTIYDYAFLLSSTPTTGLPRPASNNTYYLDGCVPEIVNMIVSLPEAVNKGTAPQKLSSNLSNNPSAQKASTRRFYLTAGVAKLEAPIKQIVYCVVLRIYLGLIERLKRDVAQEDVRRLKSFIMNGCSFQNAESRLKGVIDKLDGKELENYRSALPGKVQTALSQIPELNRNSVRDTLKKIYDKNGPFYVIKLANRVIDEIESEQQPSDVMSDSERAEVIKIIGKKPFFLTLKKHRDALLKFYREEQDFVNKWRNKVISRENSVIDESNRVYDGITKAIDEFKKILGDVTGVQTETLREIPPPESGKKEIYRWDYSTPDYRDVFSVVREMFYTRVELDGGTVRQTDKILYEKKGANPDFGKGPCCYYNSAEKGNRPARLMSVPYQNENGVQVSDFDEDKVKKVEEIFHFEGVEQAYRFDEKLTAILDEIYKSSENAKDKNTILEIILKNIQDIVMKIATAKLENLLIMLHPEGSLLDNEKDKDKRKRIQKEAVQKYLDYLTASIPLMGSATNASIGETRYGFNCIPEDLSTDFRDLLKNSALTDVGFSIPGIMLGAVIYFYFSLENYREWSELKIDFDNKMAGKGPDFEISDIAGSCLAEGPEVDWRNLKVGE